MKQLINKAVDEGSSRWTKQSVGDDNHIKRWRYRVLSILGSVLL